MAKLIKETPVLKGRDAERFLRKMRQDNGKKLEAQKVAKMRENFSKLHSLAQF